MHFKVNHARCDWCLTEFATQDSLVAHYKNAHKGRGEDSRSENQKPKLLPDQKSQPTRQPTVRKVGYYAVLEIDSRSSHEQVIKAAKEMRVKFHPDRLKRQEGLTEEQKQTIDTKAGLVGEAAEILSDPVLRRKYDQEMFREKHSQELYRRW